MAGAWCALHLWCPPGRAGPSGRGAPCAAHHARAPGRRQRPPQRPPVARAWDGDRLGWDEDADGDGADAAERGAGAGAAPDAAGEAALELPPGAEPPWVGAVPGIDEVCEQRDWPARVRDWQLFWSAVRLWRRCVSVASWMDLDRVPSDAQLAWLRLLDADGDLREGRITQALNAVEARRHELAALGAAPPAQIAPPLPWLPPLPPPDKRPQGQFDADVAAALASPALAAAWPALLPGLLARFPRALDVLYPDEDERAAAVARGAPAELGPPLLRAQAERLWERAWRERALLKAVGWRHLQRRTLPMNRLRAEVVSRGEAVLKAADEGAADEFRQLPRWQRDEDEAAEEAPLAGYAVGGGPPPGPPPAEAWDAWGAWEWRAYMEKRAARERRHAAYRWDQADNRAHKYGNCSVTTDVRIMAQHGAPAHRAHSHEEIMDCITLGGTTVHPDKVLLHIMPPGEPVDYFTSGKQFAMESEAFIESIGRLRRPDAEMLGYDPDAAASPTLDESFADLGGPEAGAEAGAPAAPRRPRDALDPDGIAEAAAAAGAGWTPPVATASFEEEDDDTALLDLPS